MPVISPHQFAMGLGVAGAMTDVSAYVEFGEPVGWSWGKQDEFRDVPPGVFSFTLNNRDGRFTPNNPASPYATTVTEGMNVSWLLGARLVQTSILAIGFPTDEASWGQLVITCDDMLGNAARRNVVGSDFGEAMVLSHSPYLYWPMDDPEGSTIAVGRSGNAEPPFTSASFTPPVFGIDEGVLGGTQAFLISSTSMHTGTPPTLEPIAYPAGSLGAWGFWVTPLQDPLPFFQVVGRGQWSLAGLSSGMTYSTHNPTTSATSGPLTVGVPHYFSVSLATVVSGANLNITASMYMDGVLQGTSMGSVPASTPTPIAVTVAGGSMNIQHLSHTATNFDESLVLNSSTEAGFLAVLADIDPAVIFDTLPADLSTAPIAPTVGGSLLDQINTVITTEQGAVYTSTTGALLAPVQKVKVRARTRPPVVSYSFDAATEVLDVPQFVRDVTNMVSAVAVIGPTQTQTAADNTVVARVGSANTSASTLNTVTGDLIGWGQDRLQRGKNVNPRVASVTIDAISTPTDRSGDLLAMIPGDRIRLTNLPATTLGFTTWDGWLLGVTETHRGGISSQGRFQLFLQPVLPSTAIFDTDRFMADGAITVTVGINASTTTLGFIASTGPKLETVVFPYSLMLDSEQVTVTACTSGVLQTATIVRAQGGTTAAAHTTACVIEIPTASLYAF